MMQARWGSHGHYEIIALAPASPQELFHLTITAFNLSETYRLPVLVMADEVVGHLSERVVIPPAAAVKTRERVPASGRRDRYKPFQRGACGVAPMAAAGAGYAVHVSGLTHDERGYPDMSAAGQEKMMTWLTEKIRANRDKIIQTESYRLDDAEIAIVSYGISARSSLAAVDEARAAGIRAGLLRLVTVWPFPEELIRDLAGRVRALVTVELNLGQIHLEVERCARGQAPAILVGHAGGAVIPPEEIVARLSAVSRT